MIELLCAVCSKGANLLLNIGPKPDGSIPQVEMTSGGLNGAALKGNGVYPATICCNLTNGKMPHGGNKRFKGLPMIAFDGKDRCLVNLKKGTAVRYKYFDLADTSAIEITARGKGEIAISCGESAPGKIFVSGNIWKPYQAEITCSQSKSVLTFEIEKGTVDILSFSLIEKIDISKKAL